MSWHDLLLRLRGLILRRQVEHELDEELQFHIAMQARKNLADGISAREARRRARFQFGGFEQAKEECRDARGTVKNQIQAMVGMLKAADRTQAVTISIRLGHFALDWSGGLTERGSPRYSVRNASIGSSRAARRAGTYAATRATLRSTTGAMQSVQGSRGPIP
jgi:hypothetical protein